MYSHITGTWRNHIWFHFIRIFILDLWNTKCTLQPSLQSQTFYLQFPQFTLLIPFLLWSRKIEDNSRNIHGCPHYLNKHLKLNKFWELLHLFRTLPPSFPAHSVLSLQSLHTWISLAQINSFCSKTEFFTSASLVLNCLGCFFANILITSGVLNAWLMAACIACKEKSKNDQD